MEMEKIILTTVIIGTILFGGIFVIGIVVKYNSVEDTSSRYKKAVEICGEGNVIQEGRSFDCSDFLLIPLDKL